MPQTILHTLINTCWGAAARQAFRRSILEGLIPQISAPTPGTNRSIHRRLTILGTGEPCARHSDYSHSLNSPFISKGRDSDRLLSPPSLHPPPTTPRESQQSAPNSKKDSSFEGPSSSLLKRKTTWIDGRSGAPHQARDRLPQCRQLYNTAVLRTPGSTLPDVTRSRNSHRVGDASFAPPPFFPSYYLLFHRPALATSTHLTHLHATPPSDQYPHPHPIVVRVATLQARRLLTKSSSHNNLSRANMFPVDSLQAAYYEEREAAETAKRLARIQEQHAQTQAASVAAAVAGASAKKTLPSSAAFSNRPDMARPASSSVLGSIFQGFVRAASQSPPPAPGNQSTSGTSTPVTTPPAKVMTQAEIEATMAAEKSRDADIVGFRAW